MDELDLVAPFEDFDPLEAVPQAPFFEQANAIVNRSRALLRLRHRDRAQLDFMAQTINYMLAYRDPAHTVIDDLDEEWADTDNDGDWTSNLADPGTGEPEHSNPTDLQLDPIAERTDKDAASDELLSPAQSPGQPGEQARSNPYWEIASPTAGLTQCMLVFDIGGQPQTPNASWAEYFAVLALALVAESQRVPAIGQANADAVRRATGGVNGTSAAEKAIGDLATEVSPHTDDADEMSRAMNKARQEAKISAEGAYRPLAEAYSIGERLVDAMDALGKAEQLHAQANFINTVEESAAEKVRLAGRDNAIRGHEKTNRIKRDYIRWLDESYIPALVDPSEINLTEAAKEYFDEFLEDGFQYDPNGRDAGLDADSAAYRYEQNWLRKLKEAERNYRKKGILPPVPTP